MNPRIAKEWTTRLRSDRTSQTQKHLGRLDGSRCCLGVLCDMAIEEGIIRSPRPFRPNKTQRGCLVFAGARHNLPPEVREWAQMKTNFGQYPGQILPGREALYGELAQPALALDNDAGATFQELADTIEQHVDGL